MREDARRHILAIVLMAAAVAAVYGASSLRPTAPDFQVDFSSIPLELFGLKGQRVPTDQEVAQFLEADAMSNFRYGQPPETVDVSLIYGAGWRTVHTPEGCFPAQGWAITWHRPISIATLEDSPHPGPLNAKLMRVEREGEALLVLFVFAHKGGTTSDWPRHSWAVATGPPGAGGLSVMITAPVPPGQEKPVEARLRKFMQAIYPHAVAFWYQEE